MQVPEAGTWYARPELWRVALEAMRDYPFTGVGLGAFDLVARANYPLRVFPDWYFGHSHNLVLQAGMDLDVAGMLSFAHCYLLGHTMAGWSGLTRAGEANCCAAGIGGFRYSQLHAAGFDAGVPVLASVGVASYLRLEGRACVWQRVGPAKGAKSAGRREKR